MYVKQDVLGLGVLSPAFLLIKRVSEKMHRRRSSWFKGRFWTIEQEFHGDAVRAQGSGGTLAGGGHPVGQCCRRRDRQGSTVR